MYDVYAPLEEFHWPGNELQLGADIRIVRFERLPNLSKFQEQLSPDEWESATQTPYWFAIEWDGAADQEPNATSNLALLALWLTRQTKAKIRWRFQVERHAGRQTIRSRVLDRFAWAEDVPPIDFTNDELAQAAQHYAALKAIYATRGRLNNALLITVSGCWSHYWQTAFICHAAAIEAILTYAIGPGITRRLATSYACTTEGDVVRRDIAYREFVELYSARSDIMHGRPHNIGVADRLPNLLHFQSLLRSLWRVVLASPQLITTLEGTDAQRQAHFVALQQGYVPPPV